MSVETSERSDPRSAVPSTALVFFVEPEPRSAPSRLAVPDDWPPPRREPISAAVGSEAVCFLDDDFFVALDAPISREAAPRISFASIPSLRSIPEVAFLVVVFFAEAFFVEL